MLAHHPPRWPKVKPPLCSLPTCVPINHWMASFQRTRYNGPMLVQCWSYVVDGVPALKQHWVNVSYPSKHKHLSNIYTTSAQRLRHWSTLYKCYRNVLCSLVLIYTTRIPATEVRGTNVVLMLGHRLQRQPNIKPNWINVSIRCCLDI